MSTFREWLKHTESEEYLEEEAIAMLDYLNILQKISSNTQISIRTFKDQEGYDDEEWVARFFDAGLQLTRKQKAFRMAWLPLAFAKFATFSFRQMIPKLCLIDDILYVFSEEANYHEDMQRLRQDLEKSKHLLREVKQARAKARASQCVVTTCDLVDQVKSMVEEDEGKIAICEETLLNIKYLKEDLLKIIYKDADGEELSERFASLVTQAIGTDLSRAIAARRECTHYRFYKRNDTADYKKVQDICIEGRKEILMLACGGKGGILDMFAELVRGNCTV